MKELRNDLFKEIGIQQEGKKALSVFFSLFCFLLSASYNISLLISLHDFYGVYIWFQFTFLVFFLFFFAPVPFTFRRLFYFKIKNKKQK